MGDVSGFFGRSPAATLVAQDRGEDDDAFHAND
jgi:hypothetical protein